MSLTMHTAAERPDLWDRGIESATVWPEYNLHGDILNQWWGHLGEELPDYQFVLYDDAGDEVVAEGHTGPFRWDGRQQSLPLGIDAVLELIFTQHRAGEPPNTLCALAAETPRQNQASGMASQLLKAMRTIATRQRRPDRSDTRLLASSDTSPGVARITNCSTRGCGSTSASAHGWPPHYRIHCSSPEPSKTGRPGRPWPSRSPANTPSLKDSPPSRSIARPTAEPTGNPTYG